MKKKTDTKKRRSLAHLLSEETTRVVGGGIANGVHVTCSGEEWHSVQTEYTQDEWRNW